MQSTRPPTPRKLRPREPITVAPVLVTQLNCLHIAGIDPERFLALVRDHGVRRAKVGKLVAVEVEELRAVLSRLSVADSEAPTDTILADDGPTSADEVLRAIGRRTA